MKRTGGITVMEEQVTSWTLLNATRNIKEAECFSKISPRRIF